MPPEIKQFSGRLNSDDSNEVILATDHKFAMNGRFRGSGNNLRFENVEGNVLISNSELPAGYNECIGSFYDSLGQRIIWFNWNSTGKHGIYQYKIVTQAVSSLLICFTDSQTDILHFDLDFPIPSVNIVYTTPEDGDLLCWTDRNQRPKILNILSAENNLYGSNWLEEYLDVAKAPPQIPIKCAYADDNTVTLNNLRKKLFIPKYRFVFGDNLKSVWSAWGKMPIPFNYTSTDVDANPQKNCRIRNVFQTGGSDVKKIEIAFAELGGEGGSAGNQWSDFFSVIVLDKAQLSIPDNDVYVWDFYNNEAYDFVDVKESALPFDYVPDKANTQELLNGNVIVYGGILEGKDPVVPLPTVTVGNEPPLTQNTSSVLSVTQSGLSGFGTGNISFVVLGTVRMGDMYSAVILVGGTPITIGYTASNGDTPAIVLGGLATSALLQGFTQISITATTLVIFQATQVLQRSNLLGVNQTITGTFVINNTTKVIKFNNGAAYINLFFRGVQFWVGDDNNTIITVVSSVVAGADLDITFTGIVVSETVTTTLQFDPYLGVSIPAYNASSKYNFGLVYFDEKGKTDGVITTEGFSATTLYYDPVINLNFIQYNIPYVNISIANRPPLWAKYYHIVRTNNLSKSKWLYWMTDRTYKDDKYAYISVESINTNKILNPQSIIGYDFAPGDRIKFYVLFNPDSTPGTRYFDQHDYEIESQVINPDINGVIRNGQFLRLILPTVDSNFDFSNSITKFYCYYLVELYTPAKSAGKDLDLSYEFGERYMIGNAGTNLAYHQGQLQNQTSDLVTPATFRLDKGDAYFRKREINVGNVIAYDLKPRIIDDLFILEQTLKSQVFPTPNYTAAEGVAYQQFPTTGPNLYNNPGDTIRVSAPAVTFKVTGTISFTILTTTVSFIRIQILVITSSGTIVQYILGYTDGGGTAGDVITYNVSKDIIMPANSKSYLMLENGGNGFRANLIYGNLNYAEASTTFNVGVIDQNFSDSYASKVNSNGRAFGVNPDEKELFYQTLLRWGLSYQQNTNINQINRFYPTNFDEVDRSKGAIQRFKSRDRILRVFQNRGVGQYGVYTKFVQSGNNSLLTTTDEILTKNNINYYAGTFGMGEQYCGLISGKNQDYFIDPVRGYQIRLSNDGMKPISELYKGQFFIQPLFPPYNKPYLRTNGSKAKIMGAYNYAEEEAVSVLQSGTYSGSLILPYTFSFNEKRNSYCSFFDFTDRDWIASAEEVIFTWKNGKLYSHNNTEKYCNFDGVQFHPSITLVFNDKVAIKKTFEALSYQANQYWICDVNGDILTSQPNPQTNLPQISSLIQKDFEINEGLYYAALLRDANSMQDARLALVEGDVLKGVFLVVKLSYKGDKFSYIYLPTIKWDVSNRNF